MKISFRLFDDKADLSKGICESSDSFWFTKIARSVAVGYRALCKDVLNIRVRLYFESEQKMEKYQETMMPYNNPLGMKNLNLKLESDELNCVRSSYKLCKEEGLHIEHMVEFIIELQVKQTEQIQILACGIYDWIKSEENVLAGTGKPKADSVDYTIIFDKDIDSSDNVKIQKFIVDTIVTGLSFNSNQDHELDESAMRRVK